jgi:tetratricopeptide (TPR) repeat protein
VLWVHASNAGRLEQSVRQTLEDLKVPGRADGAANVFQLLRNWLLDSKNGKWLLILDNVDDARYLVEPPSGSGHQTGNNQQSPPHERILDYLPASDQGSILLTSRTTEAAFKVVERSSVIVIEPMGAQHAVELLRRKLDCGYTHEEALQLAEALDFMPLAISQAAAYIGQESSRCSVQQYLKTLLESDKSRSSLLNLNDGDLRRDKEATNSIISTWQISFNHLRTIRPSAADLLSFMCFFDRQSIPESLLSRVITHICPVESTLGLGSRLLQILQIFSDKHAFCCQDRPHVSVTARLDLELDVKILRSYSFVTATTAQSFTMHSLVQFATRRWLAAQGEEEDWMQSFIISLHVAFPSSGSHENWDTCATLHPHVKVLQDFRPEKRLSLLMQASLLCRCTEYAILRDLLVDAKTMATLSLDTRTKLLGQGNRQTLYTMALLAKIIGRQGSWAEAEHLIKQALMISHNTYGVNSSEAAHCKASLANLCGIQGRWKEAEHLQREALGALRRLLGDEDSTTLAIMAELANAYRSQQLHSDAADLEAQMLSINRKVLGPQHRDTLYSMGRLAMTFTRSGLDEKGEELGVQALEMLQSTLGSQNLYTAISMGNLAITMGVRGSEDDAILLATQASATLRKVLGHEHSTTLKSMANLAMMHSFKGSYGKAIELESEVVAISERVRGSKHPDTLVAMADFADLLYDAGRRRSATDIMELCAARSLEVLAPTHPEVMERQQLAEDWRKELLCAEREDTQDAADLPSA